MPTGAESLGQQSAMQAALDAGVEQISAKGQVQFQLYTKVVLSQDGYVFWVATGQLMSVTGALHYATDRKQDEDQTIGVNQVLLSSESEITEFNLVSPLSMWIGSWPVGPDSPPLQVAFSRRGNYFVEAGVWHYDGFAVYPAMSSQLVVDATDLPQGPIVSNSLPIWLAQNSMAPVYPSFLVPDNIVPPYIVAHIDPTRTTALGSFPQIGPWPGDIVPGSGASPMHLLASWQLMRDEVTLTFYGFTNQMALQFMAGLIEASIEGIAPFGFANSPSICDAKRTQSEIASLAQKKTVFILANYYQGGADVIARRLILSAMVSSWAVIGGVAAEGSGAIATAPMTIQGIGGIVE